MIFLTFKGPSIFSVTSASQLKTGLAWLFNCNETFVYVIGKLCLPGHTGLKLRIWNDFVYKIRNPILSQATEMLICRFSFKFQTQTCKDTNFLTAYVASRSKPRNSVKIQICNFMTLCTQSLYFNDEKNMRNVRL